MIYCSYVLETLANIFCPDEFDEEIIPEKQKDDITGNIFLLRCGLNFISRQNMCTVIRGVTKCLKSTKSNQ